MRKQRSYNPEGRGLFVSIAVRRDVAYIVYGCDAAQHWQENSRRDAELLGIGAHGLVMPTDHALDEVEETAWVAAGEQDGEPCDHHDDESGEVVDEQRDVVGNGEEPLHQRKTFFPYSERHFLRP